MVASSNFYGTNREQIPKIFEVLADEANYPLVFHCAIGTDRTGYIAFLINALLGVEEESLYRDYLFSNYGNIGSSRSIGRVKLDYMTRILEYGDGTLSENCEKFLLDIGVQQAHIDAVRAILLEK
jgi:protein tyrosine/serine phosphatase